MKNKYNLKWQHFLACTFYIFIFIILYFLLTKGKFLWGSTIDWGSQHYLIPEYFRQLFYNTLDLFPDFAANLGGGQNIYYFSYYGLLSPIILVSYLLPFVKMVHYIEFTSCLIPIVSACLFYFYLRKHYSYRTSFLTGFLFLCASPIIFHSHRHIMFINYMPFLIMALFGIDSYFEKGKKSLLTISIFLIIMTSYYYSVGALFILFCYGIYQYLQKNQKIKWKDMVNYLLPFLIGILMGAIVLFPTMFTLLNGRDSQATSFNFLKLLYPRTEMKFLLYGSYAMGLTAFSMIGLIYVTFTKKKENIFLGTILLLSSLFPIINYFLNGTLYIDAKTLIPFLPIVLILVAIFLEKLFKKEIEWLKVWIILLLVSILTKGLILRIDLLLLVLILFLFQRRKKTILLTSYIIIVCFVSVFISNLSDQLEMRKGIKNIDYISSEKMIKDINKQNRYRINNLTFKPFTMNKVNSIDEFKSTLYSSTFNRSYNQFYFDIMNNPIPFRNRSMTPGTLSPLFQMYMGEKYTITLKGKPFGAELIQKRGNIKLYQNDSVLPIGYASDKIVLERDFLKLNYPSNALNLVQNIVVENYDKIKIPTQLKPINLEYKQISNKNVKISKQGKRYFLKVFKKGKIHLKLKDKLDNKILYIRFKNNVNPKCGIPELSITINGIKNKLSCKTWKYHNQNYIFDYSIYNTQDINIQLTEGNYELSDFEFYLIDNKEIENIAKEVDHYKIDDRKTKGDKISGNIKVKNDGYFTISIPYDKGFTIKVDSKIVKYEKVNTSFIGFPIKKGNHHIELEYNAPYKKISFVLTIIGFIGLFLMAFKERKLKK